MRYAIRLASQLSGFVSVGVGLLALAWGSLWAPQALELFADNAIGTTLELLVPFLPIFLISLGAFLLVESRRWKRD